MVTMLSDTGPSNTKSTSSSCMLIKDTSGRPPLSDATPHSVTLVPRLEYCAGLLDETVCILEQRTAEIRSSNRNIACDPDDFNWSHADSVERERTAVFSLEALLLVRMRMQRASDVGMIPGILSPLVPVIRTVSAGLHRMAPDCSQNLSKLSIYMGSIILDSAALTRVRFDFEQSGRESSVLLDKVKLMADSKISKQYPNVDPSVPYTA